MPPKFVLQMDGVSKYYDDIKVLDDISLSFFYGAKIGIVGENGAGKSTLLRIMAGEDTKVEGEVRLTKEMRVVHVPQEPQLDPEKNVRENLEDAVRPIKEMLSRYDEISMKMGEDLSDEEMNTVMEEMATLQEEIEAVDGWEIDRHLDMAADALVLPPDEADVTTLSGGERRRVAL
ncbi:MAG: ATP-binding cassette domain-containing protein, partial [Planctomycetota bacterium]